MTCSLREWGTVFFFSFSFKTKRRLNSVVELLYKVVNIIIVINILQTSIKYCQNEQKILFFIQQLRQNLSLQVNAELLCEITKIQFLIEVII